MRRFLIKHSFNLKSANFRLMLQGMRYATESQAEIDELVAFSGSGSCEEIVSKGEVKKVEKVKNDTETAPEEDLSTVKGLGASLLGKLAEKQILKKSDLSNAMLDKSREEEMKELLGSKYDKVLAQFVSA